MKISYFITHFPYKNKVVGESYAVRGAEAAADNLASVLAQKGHEISIFTSSASFKSEIEEYNGIKVYRYGTNFKVASGIFSFGLLKNPVKYPVDIVHAHISVPMGDIAGLGYAKKKRVPFVVTYHGDLQEDMGGVVRRISVHFYNKYLLDKVLSRADIIISPSEHYIDESRFLGKYRDKIVVIPNGINLEDFDIGYSKEECREKLGLPLDGKIILFLGTLGPHKGPDILVKAMPRIIKEIPDAMLLFVGKGEMEKELRLLSKKLGVNKHIKFAGFVGDSFKKALFYKSADIFAFPSFSEIFGIVNLEAMACGIPIVASNVGGIPDVVKDEENGLLVPPGDSEVLADVIIYLLENEDVREKMGQNGRDKVKDYSWDRIAKETEKVYYEVLS